MPKDKERTVNPAAAQRKAEKQKALKKSKAAVAAQRTERLAHRNPERLQRQIDELKALEADTGKLSTRDKKTLEDLERDVVRVRKAKEAVGDKVPPRNNPGEGGARGGYKAGQGLGRDGILGKRARDWKKDRESEDSATDESVRNIPMPRDTPPPVPVQRPRQSLHASQYGIGNKSASNANATPLGEGRGGGERIPHALPDRPAAITVQAQTTYEAKPAVRDLRKEAVSRFVPSVVQQKLKAGKGGVGGRLIEEEELQKLENEGYSTPGSLGGERGGLVEPDSHLSRGVDSTVLAREEDRFEAEMRQMKSVQMEDIRDEDL
ncbi:hypothetical protein MMC13_004718 [Lambiella insularis]|nr:hypothetical protein [Lambiella insularis]